jgi:hypothetical protein
VKSLVLPYVAELARKEREATKQPTGQDQSWLESWWQHFRARTELIDKIEAKARYLVCSRVTKRPIFMFLSSKVRPSDALTCFALDDDYSFGILQSRAHYLWFHAKCSNMKADPRYTSDSVFKTFPWPQSPTSKQVDDVVAAARAIAEIRATSTAEVEGGLRALYRTLDLPGANPLKSAHADLDSAVLAAFGFAAKKDVLQQLLDLNVTVEQAIEAGEAVAGPGIPAMYKSPARLVSKDSLGT